MQKARNFRNLTILILLFVTIENIEAQENEVTYQGWVDFTPQYYLADKVEAYGDAGFRTNFEDDKWRRFHIRPSIRYKYSSKLEFHAGLGAFYTLSGYTENQFEVRPWQGVKINWPSFNRLRFDHFFRMEEQFIKLMDTKVSNYNSRFRYRLAGMYRLTRSTGGDFWNVEAKSESFFPFGNTIDKLFRNRVRVTAGLGKHTKDGWSYTVLLNYQGSKTGPDDNINLSHYAIQFKVKKTIVGKK